jgi:hypothetical protein
VATLSIAECDLKFGDKAPCSRAAVGGWFCVFQYQVFKICFPDLREPGRDGPAQAEPRAGLPSKTGLAGFGCNIDNDEASFIFCRFQELIKKSRET